MNIQTRSMTPGAASMTAEQKAQRAGMPVNGYTRLMLGQHAGNGGDAGLPPGVQHPYVMRPHLGEILAGNFVVPQNPVRRNTGTSGIGQLRRMARLQGIGALGQDPTVDPTADGTNALDIFNAGVSVDPSQSSDPFLTVPPPTVTGGDVVGGIDANGNTIASLGGNTVTFPPGSQLIPITQNGVTVAYSTGAIPNLGIPANTIQAPVGYSGPTVLQPGQAQPAAPAGYAWATVANSAGNTLAKLLAVSQGGAAITLPNGNQLLYGSAASASTAGVAGAVSGATSSSVLLLAGAAVLVLLVMKGK